MKSSSPPKTVRATRGELLNTRFDRWYPIFRKITIRSSVLPLSAEFVRYVLSDGVVLPRSAAGDALDPCDPRFKVDSDDEDVWTSEDSTDDDNVDDDEAATRPERPSFPDLERIMREKIEWLGGEVFVKVNWSSPRDAKWATGTLKCRTPGEVFLLLKSSDFVAQSLSSQVMTRYCDASAASTKEDDGLFETNVMVLRRWGNINPAMEFRCFIRENVIIAACQRDAFSYYDFLAARTDALRNLIFAFHRDRVCPLLSASDLSGELRSYVMDVFIDRKDRVHLIDVNVFGVATSPLLYTWEELAKLAPDRTAGSFELRLVNSTREILPSEDNFYRLPKDVLDVIAGSTAASKESAAEDIAEIAKSGITAQTRASE